MPIHIGDYDYTFMDGDLTVPNLVNIPRRTFPIDNDSAVYNLEEDYEILGDFYEPLIPGQRHPDHVNLFWVKDSNISPVGNGVHSYTRNWAMLPGLDASGRSNAYSSVDYDTYVFTVPGINPEESQQLFLQYDVSFATTAGGNTTLHSTANHDIEVNHGVTVNYVAKDPLNGNTYLRSVYRIAKAGTGGSILVVSAITDVSAINWTSGASFKRSDGTQDPYQLTVTSRTITDYWLPGVTPGIKSELQIPIIQQFKIIGSSGNKTDLLSDITSPSLDVYLSMVSSGQWIVAEPSALRIWQGTIYQRSTRYVKATI